MTEVGDKIIRIAARGDGVTADGRHVPGAVTGDSVTQDGKIIAGPHRIDPACKHFGTCGGCQLQNADDPALVQFVADRVLSAAEGQGVPPEEVLPTHLSPPGARRRLKLHAVNGGGGALLGFKQERSHRITPVSACPVAHPSLVALIAPLRALLRHQGKRFAVEIDLTKVDQGVDCTLRGYAMEGLDATEATLEFAREHGLARLNVDLGYGAEALWEPEPVTVTLSGTPVPFPAGAFLQATKDAQEVLVADAVRWLEGIGACVDLFAGLGTFAFALAGNGKVLAVEAARDAHLASLSAARRTGLPVAALHRDLFRNPLRPDELAPFQAVVLDPPRAGAREQVAQLAASTVTQIAYISCNPASWARDARQLVDAGFKLKAVRPVGQFRWSTHVELSSLFVR